MKRFASALALLFVLALPAHAAERDSILITFGRNEGMAAFDRVLLEQGSQIQELVNRQLHDSTLYISVQSNADGVRYAHNHIKKNAAMTMERNVTGATILEYFHADMGRVTTVGMNVESDTGSTQRYVLLRLQRYPVPQVQHLSVPIVPPAPEKQVVTSTVYTTQFLSRVWLGAGIAYAPTNRVVPMVQGQWGNESLRFLCEASHSIYQQDRVYAGDNLDVSYRYVMVGVAWRAIRYSQFDLVAGWQRSEVYANDYGKYAQKLEGPAIGLRLELGKYFALAGIWTPCEVNTRGQDRVEHDNGRLFLSLSAFTSIIGGNAE